MRVAATVLSAWILQSCASTPGVDETARALVRDLIIADRPAGNYPIYSLPEMQIPGQPKPPPPDPDDPRLRAYEAVKKLRAMGMAAWPALIESVDDNRQSIPLAAEIPCKLGRACFHLIADVINARAPRGHFDDYDFILDGDDLRDWWKERQGRGLRELKIEAALFAWTLAGHARPPKDQPHYAKQLLDLGVADPEIQAKPFRDRLPGLSVPKAPEALVPLLAPQSGATYMDRRFAIERSGNAWRMLREFELAAFPALIEGMKNPDLRSRCFGIIEGTIHHWGIEPHNDLLIINADNVAAWWEPRRGKPLIELQREAARHALEGAKRKKFDTEEEKTNLVEFIQEQLDRIK